VPARFPETICYSVGIPTNFREKKTMNRTSIRLSVCGLIAVCLIGALGLSTALSRANSPQAPSKADGPGLISRVEQLEARVRELERLHTNILGNSLTGVWYVNGQRKDRSWLVPIHDKVILVNHLGQVEIGEIKDRKTIRAVLYPENYVEEGKINDADSEIQFKNVKWTRKPEP
jgi:hypothetical protein